MLRFCRSRLNCAMHTQSPFVGDGTASYSESPQHEGRTCIVAFKTHHVAYSGRHCRLIFWAPCNSWWLSGTIYIPSLLNTQNTEVRTSLKGTLIFDSALCLCKVVWTLDMETKSNTLKLVESSPLVATLASLNLAVRRRCTTPTHWAQDNI